MLMRWRLGLGLFFILCGISIRAYSFPITITATGDNYLYYYDWAKNSWEKLDEQDYDSWKSASMVSLDWDSDWEYLVFAVKNRGTGSSGNPAGLLAQIDMGGVKVLSDESWEVFGISNGWSGVPGFDVEDYLQRTGWSKAEWYADNMGAVNPLHSEADEDGDGVSFWYESNGGSILGIGDEAKWIWTGRNFSSDMDKGALFRVSIDDPQNAPLQVAPEADSFALVLVGFLVVMGYTRQLKGA